MEQFEKNIKKAVRAIVDAANVMASNPNVEEYVRESIINDNPDKELTELVVDYIVFNALWQ
jgi:hypothetical protein